MGTQKNRLNMTVLLSTQNTFELKGKEINAILGAQTILTWTHDVSIKEARKGHKLCMWMLYLHVNNHERRLL